MIQRYKVLALVASCAFIENVFRMVVQFIVGFQTCGTLTSMFLCRYKCAFEPREFFNSYKGNDISVTTLCATVLQIKKKTNPMLMCPGRSYSVFSQRMLNQCLESLVQKIQSGVVIKFEKTGPDPPPLEGKRLICSCFLHHCS